MTGSIRAFVAVEPSAAMKRELARLIGKLGSDATTGLRLTRPESVHLTLSFLGDIRTDSVSPIIESLTAAVSAPSPFEIGLGPTGVLPEARLAQGTLGWIDREPARAGCSAGQRSRLAGRLGVRARAAGLQPHT